jgi:ElaA protein
MIVADDVESGSGKALAESDLPEEELTAEAVHQQQCRVDRIAEGLITEIDPRGQNGDRHVSIFGCPHQAGKPDRASVPIMTDIHDRYFNELDAATFHDLLRLRIDVFVSEQGCPYAELDGLDTHPKTRHVWLDGTPGPVAYLRVLVEPDGNYRIGRVVTRFEARGNGLAGVLLDYVHATTPGRLVLDAQTYLVPWYASLGYLPTGEEFVEEGIGHVPMAREAAEA